VAETISIFLIATPKVCDAALRLTLGGHIAEAIEPAPLVTPAICAGYIG